jgi:hypothetical protein
MDLDVWMNVLDLCVHMDVLYIMWIYCASFVILAVLVIMFFAKKLTQANLRQLGLGPHRLACVMYEGQLQPS